MDRLLIWVVLLKLLIVYKVYSEPLRDETIQDSIIQQIQQFEDYLSHGSLKSFPTYSEANSLIDEAISIYPKGIRRFIIGESINGLPLYGYHIGNNTEQFKQLSKKIYNEETKSCLYSKSDILTDNYDTLLTQSYPSNNELPIVMLSSLHHAREPCSLTAGLYFILRLISMAHYNSLNKDVQLEINIARYIFNKLDIIYIPFGNPDGYIAIEKMGDIYLRKNRRITCPQFTRQDLNGVDLNRNYDFHFKAGDVCDQEEYGGEYPFSEPETRAIRCVTDSFSIRSSLSLHTYGDTWTHPFNCCNNTVLPPKLAYYYEQVSKTTGITVFDSSGRIPSLNYTSSGEEDDWLLGKRGIIPIGPEIGPLHYGFWPPQHAITKINVDNYWRLVACVIKTGIELQLTGYSFFNNTFQFMLTNNGLSTLPPFNIELLSCQTTKCLSILDWIPNSLIIHEPSKTLIDTYTPHPLNLKKNLGHRKLILKKKTAMIFSQQIESILPQSSSHTFTIPSFFSSSLSPLIFVLVKNKGLCYIGFFYFNDVLGKTFSIPVMNTYSISETECNRMSQAEITRMPLLLQNILSIVPERFSYAYTHPIKFIMLCTLIVFIGWVLVYLYLQIFRGYSWKIREMISTALFNRYSSIRAWCLAKPQLNLLISKLVSVRKFSTFNKATY